MCEVTELMIMRQRVAYRPHCSYVRYRSTYLSSITSATSMQYTHLLDTKL